jgi:succinyl-CoA synthetase beta subunit
MKIYEYTAKDIFKKNGIPVPQSYLAGNPIEAKDAVTKIEKPVALKSQVLVGGRGKSGGIKFANTPKEAYKVAEELLGTRIKKEVVNKILVEEKIDIKKELYLSVAVDRTAKKPLIMASSEGGVNIEELARDKPDKIIKYHVTPLLEFLPYQAREIARKMGVESPLISKIGSIIWRLFTIFKKYDATITEINPLVLTNDGIIAADAKLDIDNDALYRQRSFRKLEETPKDEFTYVKLEGNIAVIGNGAGLTLSSMDMLKLYGGSPATFLDLGMGGASPKTIGKALNQVISDEDVKVVFLNVLGGITRADDVAKGVLKLLDKSERKVPLVIRLTGTNEEEGQRILTEAGISFETSMEAAARKAVELCEKV